MRRHHWRLTRRLLHLVIYQNVLFVATVVDSIAAAIDISGYFTADTQQARTTTIETDLGAIVGRVLPDGTHAFLGIPYALPPVGKLRFEPPVPLASWGGGKLQALEFGAECMQGVEHNPTPPSRLSEDCLFLNVWTPPGAKRASKIPVMIWLYGGGFQLGASSHPEYDGARLAQRGVVIVSINYRLGALGWMVSDGDHMYGNYGLQDQRVGMEWVRANIAAFGGDPERVTLFGESAGAMSIGQHLHMDGAGVLFHQVRRRPEALDPWETSLGSFTGTPTPMDSMIGTFFTEVIMQSNPLGYRFRSLPVADFLGQAMKRGLDCDNLECLQDEPASEIIRIQESIMGVPRSVGDFFTWGPVVTDNYVQRQVRRFRKTWNQAASEKEEAKERKRWESSKGHGKAGAGKSKSRDLRRGPDEDYTAPLMVVAQPLRVLADSIDRASSPAHQLVTRDGRPRRRGAPEAEPFVPPSVPVMLGVNADEGLMFVHGAFPLAMPKLVYYSFVLALFRQSTLKVLNAYGDLAEQCSETGDYRRVMSEIIHDYLFRCPNLRAAQLLQEQHGRMASVFVYEFSHPTEVPGFPECSGRSCHTAELPFVFDNLAVIKEQYSYHEESGTAAASPPDPAGEANGQDFQGDPGVAQNGEEGFPNPADVIGSAMGAVQWGVTSIVKGGLGFGHHLLSSPSRWSSEPSGDGSAEATATSDGEGKGAEVGGKALTAGSRSTTKTEVGLGSGRSLTAESGVNGEPNGFLSKESPAANGNVGKAGEATMIHGDDGAMIAPRVSKAAGATSVGGQSQLIEEDGTDVEGGVRLGRGARDVGEGGDRYMRNGDMNSSAADGDEGSCPLESKRPTVEEAGEADAFVGDAMATYWTSFGKAGDPNSALAPVLWPAWEGRQRRGLRDATDAAAAIASGGGLENHLSSVLAEALLQGGGGGGYSGAGLSLERGDGTVTNDVTFFLDIKAQPEVRQVRRDCRCEFWDKLKYRH